MNDTVRVPAEVAIDEIVGASGTVAAGVPVVAELGTPERFPFARSLTWYEVPFVKPEITIGDEVDPLDVQVDPLSVEYS